MWSLTKGQIFLRNFLTTGGILLSLSAVLAILAVPKLWRTDVNKAIQSMPGAHPAKNTPDACEMDCMWACVQDANCTAYSFDESDGTCKNWNHLFFELVDKLHAKSFFRSMS